MQDQKNFILAIALSFIVLVAWQVLVGLPQADKTRKAQQEAGQTVPGAPPRATPIPGVPAAPVAETREQAAGRSPRIAVETPSLKGSIALKGGRIDDLSLARYRETVDPKSANIVLFSPPGSPHPYFAEFGWLAPAGGVSALPTADTLWTADGDKLTPAKPVTLSWDNGQGLVFRRVISVDDTAMFTVKDVVENKGQAPVTLSSYGLVARHGTPVVQGYYVLHEGLIGVLGDKLQEIGYKDLDKEREKRIKSTGGFIGITDKYWAAAIIPDQSVGFDGWFTSTGTTRKDYQTIAIVDAKSVPPAGALEATTRLFAGAKEVHTVDGYEKSLGVKRFDLLIDWGWFYFITKPLFYLMDWIFRLFGNFGVAILLVTVFVKAVFFPLANKSYASMAKMKAVQPEMMAIRDRYADDKLKQQQELMALYKKEKINPLAGCWPILIQIPVFFALYKVLFVTIEMRQAPFFGWIKDLAAPDPTSIFNLFGLLPYHVPDFLLVGIWPIIMGITMFVQMKMNPEPTDPIQKAMFSWMPLIFTFMLATFPAGLVIYWAWNNSLSILQQYAIMKKQGVKVELWDNLRGMLAKPAPKPAEVVQKTKAAE